MDRNKLNEVITISVTGKRQDLMNMVATFKMVAKADFGDQPGPETKEVHEVDGLMPEEPRLPSPAINGPAVYHENQRSLNPTHENPSNDDHGNGVVASDDELEQLEAEQGGEELEHVQPKGKKGKGKK